MENYSSIKKNKILPFAATWMDFKSIMRREICQTKTNTVQYHLSVESKKYNNSEYNNTEADSQIQRTK